MGIGTKGKAQNPGARHKAQGRYKAQDAMNLKEVTSNQELATTNQ